MPRTCWLLVLVAAFARSDPAADLQLSINKAIRDGIKELVVEDGAAERMGPNEADGITNALNKKNENLKMAKERR